MFKKALLFLICLMITSNIFCQISHFPFDTNMNDIVNGYIPTAFGNPTIITDDGNQVLQLEGDEYLSLPNAVHEDINPNQNLEIQLRFKITDFYDNQPFPGTGEFGDDGKRILISNKVNSINALGFEIYVTELDGEYRILMSFGDDTERGGTWIFNDVIEENTWVDMRLILRLNNEIPNIVYKLNGYYHHFPLNYLDVNQFKTSLNTQQFWVGTDQENAQSDFNYAYAETSIDYLKIFNPVSAGNTASVASGLSMLTDHVNGTITLTEIQQQEQLVAIVNNWDDNTYAAISTDVLSYISVYEQSIGTVYEYYTETINPKEVSIPRALQFMLIQYIVDNNYTNTNVTNMSGVSFLDHTIIPGIVDPAAPRVNETVDVDGDYNTNPGYYMNNQEFVIRPTGYYAAPGEIVDVTFPAALVNQGVKIHVGAHFVDYREDYRSYRRFPTLATKYPVDNSSMSVANPFGGAIYITFPDGSNFGSTTIEFDNAVKSPYYSNKTGFSNSLSDYQTDLSNAYVNWVDLESNNFMATCPRAIAEISPNADAILDPMNEIIGNFNIIAGRPLTKIRSEYMVSEPESYTQGTIPAAYPVSIVNGDLSEADVIALPVAVLDPSIYMNIYEGSTLLHELGHLHNLPTMDNESETNIDLFANMAYNATFGVSPDTALFYSLSFQYLTKDQAALDWLLDQKFRNNESITYEEVSYQARGLGKYADVSSLFSWDSLGLINKYWYDEAINSGEIPTGRRSVSIDEFIEVASDQLGFNFAPLWEIWGCVPSQALVDQLDTYPDENRIRDRILHYRSLVPANAAEFLEVYNSITPNIEDHHKVRYDAMLGNYDESVAESIYLRIDDILCKYFDVNCVPLPVELLTFTGEAKQRTVQLDWITVSELNNWGFEVQKSLDGRNWGELDFVEGKGTANQQNEYVYLDLKPFLGMNYYRLRQMDYDHTFEYSNSVAIEFKTSENTIKIFPNPVNDFLTIDGLTNHTIRIFSLKGELVKELFSEENIDIDFTEYSSGVYLVEIKDNINQEIQMSKIIKQ